MNLEDIARMAGVSRSTVSRVVNNDPRVSDAVRLRVQQIIDQSNYHPNAAARSLASRRTRIVGLLIPQEVEEIFVDSWFSQLIQGCLRACTDADLSLMLLMERTNEAESVERVVRRAVRGAHLDGLVISSSFVDDLLLSRLREEQFPNVLIGRYQHHDAHFVDVDNRGASFAATKHLLGHGRTAPVMISGPRHMVASNDRVRGFREAVIAHGLESEPVPVLYADWSQQAAYQQTLDLYRGGYRPDAVFTANDAMAIGVIQALRHLGLRVPDDVGVVGFDDIDRERNARLGLTTVYQPIADVARTAIAMLQDQQAGAVSPPIQQFLPTRLIVRTSCGCAPADGSETDIDSGLVGAVTSRIPMTAVQP